MYRSAHRWVSRSMLTDLFDPRWWLTTGGTAKARVAAPKAEEATGVVPAPTQAVEQGTYDLHIDKPGDGAALSDSSSDESGDVVGDMEGHADEGLQLREQGPVGLARSAADGRRATASRTVAAPGFVS